MTSNLRCLVVDDSALSRKLVRTALESIPGVEVVGIARDGVDAIERCKEYQADFVTMDLEMPRMNGIDAVRALKEQHPHTKVIMVSSLTSAGANITYQALHAGAFDFVTKPLATNLDDGIRTLSMQLADKIASLRESTKVHVPATKIAPTATHVNEPRVSTKSLRSVSVRALCLGISTGGPVALNTVIPSLPASLSFPIFLVQHMPPVFTKSLADQLDRNSKVTVVEAADGMMARDGWVYIAPGGKQMKVDFNMGGLQIKITDDAPESNAKPSVDYLFRHLAPIVRDRLVAAVLTGMGADGTVGCREIKKHGGQIITQDAASCVVYGMPRSVAEAGLTDAVFPLSEIGTAIAKLSQESLQPCR
ncbi:MAG: chemotaxis response regulator protein-glutamate methylesterase [Planctomycetales bacterium]|nr:chemotaxis response regulator protein-glutamate methylesterase [Planctomycetales bacterium]